MQMSYFKLVCLTLTWDVFKSVKGKIYTYKNESLTLTWDVFKLLHSYLLGHSPDV